MPDFAMCLNESCEWKSNCKRYLAKPDTYQYYADFKFENGKCDDYWPVEEKPTQKQVSNTTALNAV